MPFQRFHPLRASESVRDENADVHLLPGNFIYPFFVIEGANRREKIQSLKNIERLSADLLLDEVKRIYPLGVDKVMLFGVVDDSRKMDDGQFAYSQKNPVVDAIRQIREEFPQITIVTDVCLCAYTSHGHCGVLCPHGTIDNDRTLPYLAEMALTHAKAGAHIVAPSAMMDGQVQAIRTHLDHNGYQDVRIMGYSAKYASSFYGPFRDAAKSAPGKGHRKEYQMDYRTTWQGVLEAGADIQESADYVMVKPAHTYLDMISRVKEQYPETPLAAYHTSGEYMMIVAAAEQGLLNMEEAMVEALTAIKRAGADLIISYYALEYAKLINS